MAVIFAECSFFLWFLRLGFGLKFLPVNIGVRCDDFDEALLVRRDAECGLAIQECGGDDYLGSIDRERDTILPVAQKPEPEHEVVEHLVIAVLALAGGAQRPRFTIGYQFLTVAGEDICRR